MYIEDLIDRLSSSGQYLFLPPLDIEVRDQPLLSSFSDQILRGYGLSEKQAALAVKFCKKYRVQLSAVLGKDITLFTDDPIFRLPIRKIALQSKKVEVVEHNKVKSIKVSFPYDEKLLTELRAWNSKPAPDTATWDSEAKAWMFTLTEGSVDYIKNVLVPTGFATCEKFDEIWSQLEEISSDFDRYVPRLTSNGEEFSYVNTHPSIPQPSGLGLLETLFHAKRYGISVWDEDINDTMKNLEISKLTRKFLATTGKVRLEVDSGKYEIEHFSDLAKYASPCLVIIPAGTEIVNLKKWWGFLNSENFQKNQVSVMFRTENGNDKMFNELVKDYGLNSPISEDTKFVFVSQKLPKPVIKSGIHFNSVINLGSMNTAHYTLTSFLQDFPDIIVYNSKATKGDAKWPHVELS